MVKPIEILVLLLAAVFEVGGDALIRAGLRGEVPWVIALGFAILGSYGLVLNQLQVDFSKLLGGYVATFALVSIAFGKVVFRETVSVTTWIGLAMALVGGALMQWG